MRITTNKKTFTIKKIETSRITRRPGKVWIIAFSMLAIVIASQLIVTNILAGKGSELGKLQTQVRVLSVQNQALEEELAGKTSLHQVAFRAKELGLSQTRAVMYLDLSSSVAVLPQ